MTCFLFGHADAPSDVIEPLTEAIEHHIVAYGVREFLFGYHGMFDALVLRALADVKQRYPEIRRTLVLSYHPAQDKSKAPKEIDGTLYPFDEYVPPRYAIIKANEQMIRQCDYVIAYVCGTGKSRDFLEYAQRQTK